MFMSTYVYPEKVVYFRISIPDPITHNKRTAEYIDIEIFLGFNLC